MLSHGSLSGTQKVRNKKAGRNILDSLTQVHTMYISTSVHHTSENQKTPGNSQAVLDTVMHGACSRYPTQPMNKLLQISLAFRNRKFQPRLAFQVGLRNAIAHVLLKNHIWMRNAVAARLARTQLKRPPNQCSPWKTSRVSMCTAS